MATRQIQQGDTLSGIAQRENTTVDAILGLNPNITNPDVIQAGATLNLPDNVAQIPDSIDADTAANPPTIERPPTEEPKPVEPFVESMKDFATIQAETAQSSGLDQAQANRTELQKRLEEALQETTGKSVRLAEEEQRLGIPQDINKLREVNLQLTSLTNEFERRVAALPGQGRGITSGIIEAQTARERRLAAVEIGALASVQQAIQGNIALAQQTAQRTVDLEFEPIEKEIQNVKTLLDLNYQNLTSAEKRQADELAFKLDERQRKLDERKQEKMNIQDIALQALRNGADTNTVNKIIKSQTLDQALSSSAGLLNEPNLQVIDVGGRKKVIDISSGQIVNDLGVSDASTPKPEVVSTDMFGNPVYGIYNAETNSFDTVSVPNVATYDDGERESAVINAMAGLDFSSVSAKKQASADINRLLAQGNIDEAKDLLKRYARNSASATALEKIEGKEDLVNTLNVIEQKMIDFEANGGDLNVFTGLSEEVLEKGGFVKDPKLANLANEIAVAIIDYRKAVSGAAFTPEESDEYKAIFPSTGKTLELNREKIDSLKGVSERQIESFYSRRIGENNWDALFGSTRSTNQLTGLNQSYNSLDALVADRPEYYDLVQDIINNDPNISDIEVLQEVHSLSQGFSPPLGTGIKGLENLNEGEANLSRMGSGTITGFGSKFWKAGLDFVLSGGKGALVRSPFTGTVVDVIGGYSNPSTKPLADGKKQNSGFGNQVKLRLPDGSEVWVSHLDDVSNLRTGQVVSAGTPIGRQGNTGATYGNTGVHLDITMKKPDGGYYSPKEVAAILGDSRIS